MIVNLQIEEIERKKKEKNLKIWADNYKYMYKM
jgi:hypothetical protein